jgi:hypothetical protein
MAGLGRISAKHVNITPPLQRDCSQVTVSLNGLKILDHFYINSDENIRCPTFLPDETKSHGGSLLSWLGVQGT